MKISEALQIARERIALPGNWAQGSAARDDNGVSVRENHERASCWCAAVAIRMAAPGLFRKSLAACEVVLPHGVSVPWFNDHRSHDAVLGMFDRAIAKSIAAGD
jgi:hypothetical protein